MLGELQAGRMSADYLHKHAASIHVAFNDGVREGCLPEGFAPFLGVDCVKVPARIMGKGEWPTSGEKTMRLMIPNRW